MAGRCWTARLREHLRRFGILIPTDVTLAFRIVAGLVRRLAWATRKPLPAAAAADRQNEDALIAIEQ